MFLTKRFHREILAAQKTESDRLIGLLADEVEFLRLQLGQAHLAKRASLNPADQPPMVGGAPAFVSEDEELLREAHAEGHIDDAQLARLLEQNGFPITDVESD